MHIVVRGRITSVDNMSRVGGSGGLGSGEVAAPAGAGQGEELRLGTSRVAAS